MKKQYLFFILLIAVKYSSAQVDPLGDFNKYVVANWQGEYIRVSQYRVKGTPYLLGESFPGSIIYKGGRTAANTKIFYDIYSQKAGTDLNNQLYEMAEGVDQFVVTLPEKFGGQKLLFKNSDTYGANAPAGYLNVLEDGEKVTLLKMFKTRLSPDPTNTMAKDLKVFEQYYEYYLYTKSDKTLHKIKLKEKEFLKALNNDPQVKENLSKNNVDPSKEPGAIELIRSYNSAGVQ